MTLSSAGVPDVRVNFLEPSGATASPGEGIPVIAELQNYGTGPEVSLTVDFYISPHSTYDASAVRLFLDGLNILDAGTSQKFEAGGPTNSPITPYWPSTAAVDLTPVPHTIPAGNDYLIVVVNGYDSDNTLYSTAYSTPITVVDATTPVEPQSTLPVAIGGAATISHGFLWSNDPDNTPGQLTYTIIDRPVHGTLLDNGVAATSFTQADIDNGLVKYVENGDPVKSDSFTFTVSDPAGNSTATETFSIAVLDHAGPVVTGGGKLSVAAGGAAPLLNPALDTVSLGNTPDQIAYTLLLPPEHGLILDDGAPATGFTQADIDSHRVQYVASGDGATSDAFVFQATDAAGNHTGPQPFAIQIQGSSDLVLSGGGSAGTAGQADQTFTFEDVSTPPGGGADAPPPAAADLIDPAGSLALSNDTGTYDAMILWTLSYSSSSGSQG